MRVEEGRPGFLGEAWPGLRVLEEGLFLAAAFLAGVFVSTALAGDAFGGVLFFVDGLVAVEAIITFFF